MGIDMQSQVLAKGPAGKSYGDSECEIWTIEQAGRRLGISRGTAYALAKKGDLPTVRLGRRLLVPRAALDRLLAV